MEKLAAACWSPLGFAPGCPNRVCVGGTVPLIGDGLSVMFPPVYG